MAETLTADVENPDLQQEMNTTIENPSNGAPSDAVPGAAPSEAVPDAAPSKAVPDANPSEAVPDANPSEAVPDANPSEAVPDGAPSGAGPDAASPSPPPRRGIRDRERDSRERRDIRDFDRPPGREYYDRNRSPPPRERDYHKRDRMSHSPPPPYRDRRGGPNSSPPRRSPPFPPSKRRRDDGYDGRRGSPRGGYGHGDRRFVDDYPGGYERENGGRSGYHDERPRGRSDWDSERGVFADAFNTGGLQREGMLYYKQFILELEDDILPAEAERRYQEYKAEYISTQKKTFFNAHKDEEWLKDKYHPQNLIAVIERRNEIAKKLAKDFQVDLQSGTLDLGPSLSPSSNKAKQPNEPNSDNEADVPGKRRQPKRVGVKESDVSSAPKAHLVCSEPRRILADIEKTLALVRKLDSEKGIEDNVLCSRADNDKSHGSSSGPTIIIRDSNTIKGLEGIELLDTLLTYLWRIHGIDYYGLAESNESKGFRHVRVDGKSSENIIDDNEWERKLDSRWQERLKSSDPLEIMTGKEKVDAAAAEALEPFVRKIRDEKYGWKYGCGAKGCTKLFHATGFVHKHLRLKHPELMTVLTTKVQEELYIQNYMNDENAPGGTPVMQSSLKDRLQRGRPGFDNRIKDYRGDRRERNNRDNGNEHFDRSENPQLDDFSNGDEKMFDSFGGHGISVAAFSSDITPPLLMPVPGAGPLGPFVPAPPEVAMQMMRDQGGPPPLEGGRNGRSGPSPIIVMPPNLRQDPRRLRSYNDLDAPDDDVMVIDYRSL